MFPCVSPISPDPMSEAAEVSLLELSMRCSAPLDCSSTGALNGAGISQCGEQLAMAGFLMHGHENRGSHITKRPRLICWLLKGSGGCHITNELSG